MPNKKSIFIKRKQSFAIFFLLLILVFAFSATITNYNPILGLKSMPEAFVWMANNFVPNQKSFTKLPDILSKLKETFLLAVATTVTASIFALLLSLLGSNTTKINLPMSKIARVLAAFFRNVPDVVWSMILLFSFGQNILTGYFALFFTTFGMLTRAFIEIIDEVSASSVEALKATGAGYMEIVFQSVIPSSITQFLTWIMFMIETNIRSSTLIGILTATGIGYSFDRYYKNLDYATASLVVICIISLVVLIEILSNYIRKVIL